MKAGIRFPGGVYGAVEHQVEGEGLLSDQVCFKIQNHPIASNLLHRMIGTTVTKDEARPVCKTSRGSLTNTVSSLLLMVMLKPQQGRLTSRLVSPGPSPPPISGPTRAHHLANEKSGIKMAVLPDTWRSL